MQRPGRVLPKKRIELTSVGAELRLLIQETRAYLKLVPVQGPEILIIEFDIYLAKLFLESIMIDDGCGCGGWC